MRRAITILALLLAGAACTIQETGRADSMVADSVDAEEQQASEEVQRAVTVARALRASPDSAASILAAHDMTRAGLDSLLYRIAGDPRRATLYERGMAAASVDEL